MSVNNINIVLIEDSPTVRQYYGMVLEQGGFEFIEAETGSEGWNLIGRTYPDIIIMDMRLPDITGMDLLHKIKSNVFSKNIPIIVLTSLKDIQDVQKAVQIGANQYSVKGNDAPERILGMIYAILKGVTTIKNRYC